MKTRVIIAVTIIMLIVIAIPSVAQKTTLLEISTSAQCELCKERIEEAMAFERGVKKANLDLKNAVLKVEYNGKITSPEKIRKAVAKTGYDADDIKADEKAYAKLPACCKKPGDPGHVPHTR